MSPVKAPDSSARQSCPPISTPEPPSRSAIRCTSVAGGQMATRAPIGRSSTAAATALASSSEAARPFIFQFPAIRGRGVIMVMTPRYAMTAALPSACGREAASTIPRQRRRPGRFRLKVPMLAAVRNFAKSFVARILLGILIVSFAIFGIGDVFRQARSDVVVKAGSREVTIADFKREFDGYKQQTEQRVGQPITVETAVEKGPDRQGLEGLAGRGSFAELMHRMGVRIYDEQLVAQIQKIPAFFDKMTGKFDQKLYAGALAERQLTPTLFENYMRDDMAQQQMMAAMAAGLRTPRAYAA